MEGAGKPQGIPVLDFIRAVFGPNATLEEFCDPVTGNVYKGEALKKFMERNNGPIQK